MARVWNVYNDSRTFYRDRNPGSAQRMMDICEKQFEYSFMRLLLVKSQTI